MKVCILAAGPGKRLGVKTKYFNKALLKVGDKAAISHIISYFPEDYEFIIVTGYLGDIVEQYVKIAHPKAKVKFVRTDKWEGPGSGPGYAMMQCEHLLQEPFYFWTCDTLIKDPGKIGSPEEDWIGFAKAKSEDGEYSCIELENESVVMAFHEKKSSKYTGNAFIGCGGVNSWRRFWKGMKEHPKVIQDQFQISAGLDALIENVMLSGIELDWCDIGDLDKLQETKKRFGSKIENLDKEDEEIYFLPDRVVKYFYNSDISKNRYKKAELLQNLIPKLIDHSDNFYSYEYMEGYDLFDHRQVWNLPSFLPQALDQFSKTNLWEEKKLTPEEYVKFQTACCDFYYRKTKNRVDQLYKKLHFEDSENIINGEQVPKLKDIFSVVSWQKVLNGKPCLMHGDMAISNIIILFHKALIFKLIDWRQDFGGIVEYGDFYYDMAKIYASLVFPHDQIKAKQFEISTSGNKIDFKIQQPEDNRYDKTIESFEYWMTQNNVDVKKVRQLTSIVLLNMSPLHEYPLNILLYYLGKEMLWKTLKE